MLRISRGIAALLLLASSTIAAAAEPMALKGVMSWDGHGRVLRINLEQQEFLGVLEGILYIETSEGEIDEAFVECTARTLIDTGNDKTTAEGNCLIIQSGEDNVFAHYRCDGEVGACKGRFNLTGGTGRFEGIEGTSRMILRSPLHALSHDYTDHESLHVENGVIILPDLQYRLKGGGR